MLWKKLTLVPIGIVVGLLVLEGGLQLGALVLKGQKRGEIPAAFLTGNLQVLCVGDSNTYGLWLERSEAYPQQLEAIWNQRHAPPDLEVLNLGFPGTNSSRIVRDLPRLLETLDPDVLIVLVGVNDFWTLPFPFDDATSAQPRHSFLKQHSLIYRLYHLIRRGQQTEEVEIIMDPEANIEKGAVHKARVGDQEFDMGFVKADPGLQGDGISLKANLVRIVARAKDSRARFYLMTYPASNDFYPWANDIIREVARETGAPLIDLNTIFESLCPENECPEKLFPDGHPNASGYRVVAETIAARLAGRDSL